MKIFLSKSQDTTYFNDFGINSQPKFRFFTDRSVLNLSAS